MMMRFPHDDVIVHDAAPTMASISTLASTPFVLSICYLWLTYEPALCLL